MTWKPFRVRNGRIQLHAGGGCVRDEQIAWLATGLPPGKPALLVLHHGRLVPTDVLVVSASAIPTHGATTARLAGGLFPRR